VSTEVEADEEWGRLAAVVGPLVGTGVPVSIDTWRPSVARRALDAGVSWLNAAEGLQSTEMIEVAAERQCPVVVPFLQGPDPHRLRLPEPGYDPILAMVEFFDDRLAVLGRYGIRQNAILDPGTGFAPHDWKWEDRFFYQREVYSRLHELRRFDLPVYIALPWRDTAQHRELFEIVVAQDPDYGRVHFPVQARNAGWAGS
jgi:dihydropteroate synthase